MKWKGRTLGTIGDLMGGGIDACETPEEAAEFMRLYRQESPHADVNIGYLSGYYGLSEQRRIQEWFGVVHPILGRAGSMSPEEIFAKGREMGERVRRGETSLPPSDPPG